MQYGPASTRERSTTRSPRSGGSIRARILRAVVRRAEKVRAHAYEMRAGCLERPVELARAERLDELPVIARRKRCSRSPTGRTSSAAAGCRCTPAELTASPEFVGSFLGGGGARTAVSAGDG